MYVKYFDFTSTILEIEQSQTRFHPIQFLKSLSLSRKTKLQHGHCFKT